MTYDDFRYRGFFKAGRSPWPPFGNGIGSFALIDSRLALDKFVFVEILNTSERRKRLRRLQIRSAERQARWHRATNDVTASMQTGRGEAKADREMNRYTMVPNCQ